MTIWSGAGTGSLSPAILTDNVGIDTATPNEQLEITGNFRLPNSTAGAGVIKSGGDRFIHNFGTDNFFAGVNAGNLTTLGSGGNTGIGFDALASITVGFSNTATGRGALFSNANGQGNTATGESALLSNTSGSLTRPLGKKRSAATPRGPRTPLLGKVRSLPTPLGPRTRLPEKVRS